MSDQPQEQQQQNPQPSGPNIQLADLYVACQAINLGSSRGAFRAEEFVQIGTSYDRIMTFLRDSGAISEKKPQQQTDESSAEKEE